MQNVASAANGTGVSPEGPTGSDPKHGSDPVASFLLTAILLVVIVIIASMGVLLWYTMQQRKAPRTEAERRLVIAEQATAANPKRVQNWAALALAQAQAGKYSQAEATVAKGRAVSDVSLLAVVYGDIANLSGDKGEAIRRYELAKKQSAEEWKLRTQKLAESQTVDDSVNRVFVEASVAEGKVYLELKRYKEAKAQFDDALELDPRMSDVLAMRGTASVALGDPASAKKDYEEALRYDPGLPEAVNGLEALR